MAVQIEGYTDSQRAYADVLLSRAHAWTRGVRKRDGLAFVIFESSRRDADGRPLGYYTTEEGCTCKGFLYRGRCSHQLAVKLQAERARQQEGSATRSTDQADPTEGHTTATVPLRRYEDLFPACRVAGCQDEPIGTSRLCSRHLAEQRID